MSSNQKQEDDNHSELIELKLPQETNNQIQELQDIQDGMLIIQKEADINNSQQKSKIDLESQSLSNLNDGVTNNFIKELINDKKNDNQQIQQISSTYVNNQNIQILSSQTSKTKILTQVNSANRIQNNNTQFQSPQDQQLNLIPENTLQIQQIDEIRFPDFKQIDNIVNESLKNMTNIFQDGQISHNNIIQPQNNGLPNELDTQYEQNKQSNQIDQFQNYTQLSIVNLQNQDINNKHSSEIRPLEQKSQIIMKMNDNDDVKFKNNEIQIQPIYLTTLSQFNQKQGIQNLKSNIIEINIVSQKKKTLNQEQNLPHKDQNISNLKKLKLETSNTIEQNQTQFKNIQKIVKQNKIETQKNKKLDLSKFSIDGISGSNILLQPFINSKSSRFNKISKQEQQNISNILINLREQQDSKSQQKISENFKNSNSDGEINKNSSQKLNFKLYADSSKNKISRFSLKKQKSNKLTIDDHIGLSNSKYQNSLEKSNSSQINGYVRSMHEKQFSSTFKQTNQNIKFQTISTVHHSSEERDSFHPQETLQNKDKFKMLNKTSMKIQKILQHESIIRNALQKRKLGDNEKQILNQEQSQKEAEQILNSINQLQKEYVKDKKYIQLDDLISNTNSMTMKKEEVSNSMKKIAVVQSQLSSYLDNYQSHFGANYLLNTHMSPTYSVSPNQQQNNESPSKIENLSAADPNQFLSLYNSQPIYHKEQAKNIASKQEIIDTLKQKIQNQVTPKGINNFKKYQDAGNGKKQQRQEKKQQKIFPYVYQYDQQNSNQISDQLENNILSNSFQFKKINTGQNSKLPQFKKNSALNQSFQETIIDGQSKNLENTEDKATINLNQSFGGSLNSPNLVHSLIVQPINLQENESPRSRKFNNIEIEDGLINFENNQILTDRTIKIQKIQTPIQWNDMDEQNQIQVLQILQYIENVTSNQYVQDVNFNELLELKNIISQVQGIPGFLSLKKINNAVMTPLVSSQKQSLRIKRMKQVQLEKQKKKLELLKYLQAYQNELSDENQMNQSGIQTNIKKNKCQIDGNSFSLSNFKQGIVNELIKMNVFDSNRWMPTGLLIHPIPNKKNKQNQQLPQNKDQQNASQLNKDCTNINQFNDLIYQEEQNQKIDQASKYMAPANFKVSVKQRTLNNLSSSMEKQQKEQNINLNLDNALNDMINIKSEITDNLQQETKNNYSYQMHKKKENENSKFGIKLPQNKTNSQIKGIDNTFSLKTLVKIEEENKRTLNFQKGTINVQKAVINKVNLQQLRNQISLFQNEMRASQTKNRNGFASDRQRKRQQAGQQFRNNYNTISSTVEALKSNQVTMKESKDQIQVNVNYILKSNENQFQQRFQRDSSEFVKSRNQEEGIYNFKVSQKEKAIEQGQTNDNIVKISRLNQLSNEQSPQHSIEIQLQISSIPQINGDHNYDSMQQQVQYKLELKKEQNVAKNTENQKMIEPIEEEETFTKSKKYIRNTKQYDQKFTTYQQNDNMFNIQEQENNENSHINIDQNANQKDEKMDFTFKGNQLQITPLFVLNQSSQKSFKFQQSYQTRESQNSQINNYDYRELKDQKQSQNRILQIDQTTQNKESPRDTKMNGDFNTLISKKSINIVNIKKGITTASQNSGSRLQKSRMSSHGNINVSMHDRSLRKSNILAAAKSSKIGNQDISQILNDSNSKIIEKRTKNTQNKIIEQVNRNSSGLISDKFNQEEDRIQSALLIGSPAQTNRFQKKSSNNKIASFKLIANTQFKLDSNQIQKEIESQQSLKRVLNIENIKEISNVKNKNQGRGNKNQSQPFSAFKTSQIGESINENIQYNLIDYMAATNIELLNQNLKQKNNSNQQKNLDSKFLAKLNHKIKTSVKNSSNNSIDNKVLKKEKNIIQTQQISLNQNNDCEQQKRQSSPSFGRKSPQYKQISTYKEDSISQINQDILEKRQSPSQRKKQYATQENAEKMKDLLIKNLKEELKLKDPNKRRNITIETHQNGKQKKKSIDEQNKKSTKSQNKKLPYNNDLKLKYSIQDDSIGVYNIDQIQKGDQSLMSEDNEYISQSIITTPILNFSLLTPRKNSVYLTSTFMQDQFNSQAAAFNINFKPQQTQNPYLLSKKLGDKKNTVQAISNMLGTNYQKENLGNNSLKEPFISQDQQRFKNKDNQLIKNSQINSIKKQEFVSQASTFTFETSQRNIQNQQFQSFNVKQKQSIHLRNMKIQNQGTQNQESLQSWKNVREIKDINRNQNKNEKIQSQYGYDDYCSSQADEILNDNMDDDSKRRTQLINQLMLPEVQIKKSAIANIQQNNQQNNNYQDQEELFYRMHLKQLNNQLLREKLHFQRLVTQNTVHKNFELRFNQEKRNLQSKSLAANKQYADKYTDDQVQQSKLNYTHQSKINQNLIKSDLQIENVKIANNTIYQQIDQKRPFTITDKKLNTIQNTIQKDNQDSTSSRLFAAQTPIIFTSQRTSLIRPNNDQLSFSRSHQNRKQVEKQSLEKQDNQFENLLNIQMNQSSYRSKFDLNQTQNSVQFKQIQKLQDVNYQQLEKFQGITQRVEKQTLFDLQDEKDANSFKQLPYQLRQLSNQRGENIGFIKKNRNTDIFDLNNGRKNKIQKTIEQIGDYFCTTQNSISKNYKH